VSLTPKPTPPPDLAALWRIEGYLKTIRTGVVLIFLLVALNSGLNLLSSLVTIGATAVKVSESSGRSVERSPSRP
jgi:hypothetical protein